MPTYKLALMVAMLLGGHVSGLPADDWPMLGRDGTRNAVSPEKNPPTFWQIEGVPTKFENQRAIEWVTESKNVKWKAELGIETFGTPAVADGLVWIGTTYKDPDVNRAGLLKCFRERDGKLLYEYGSPVHEDAKDRYTGVPWLGISSTPLVEGDRIWFTNLAAELVCLDIAPLKREGEPTVVWKRDMRKEWGVYPWACIMGPGFTGNVAVHEHLLYAITGNGCSYDGPPPAPEAPSLVCLDKRTGELIWQDASPDANILGAQWGSPLVVEIGGRAQVIVPQGDGWIRSFNALTGELIWKFDINPKESTWRSGGGGPRNYFMGAPVFHDGRVYIASGQTPEHGEGPGRLVCIDPSKTGDISSELAVDANGHPLPQRRIQAVDPAQGERAIANPNSGLIWEYAQQDRDGNGEIDFEEEFHRSLSNVAIKDGLLIAADFSGVVHCLDAKTGKVHWTHDRWSSVWGSPLIVDDKVYVVDDDAEVAIFRLTAEAHEPLREISFPDYIHSSLVFANGTLYVANRNTLFAIASEESVPNVTATGGNWPQWRGPNRDNVSTDTGLLQQWPEEGPPLRWTVQGLGLGISTVSIADGRIFTLSQYETNEYVRALDEQTGEPLWSALLGEAPPQSLMMRWLTQRPPTFDGELLYAMSLLGDLLCLQAADGKELWRRNYAAEFAGELGLFGYSDCPIVCDDKLLCTPGGAEASIVALDKATGEVIWKCPVANGGKAAYANGVVAKIAGQTQFVTFLEKALVGVAVEDGKLIWRVDGVADVGFHPHTPLIHGNAIACINAFGQGGIRRLELERKDSAWSVKEAYVIKSSHLAQYQDDTVLREDRLYEFHHGVASCFDFATGQVLWQRRLGGVAAMTWADGRFYLYKPGQAIDLVDANMEGPVVTARCSLPQAGNASGASTPVIAGGRLYVRMDDQLFCYDVRQDAMGRSPTAASVIELLPLHIGAAQQAGRPRVGVNRAPDAVFVPTPQDVVEQMLKLAGVEKQEVVYDLGSGDGRIVITAAKTYGVQAVGVEIDPELIKVSQQRVQESKLADLVTIRHEDMFQVDLSQADVVAVFLYPRLLERLRPQLAKMKPGSRIVSHQFLMPDVEPDQVLTLESSETGDRHTLYLWTTPLKVAPPKPE